MCSALGGRAAEKLIFGKISTGALSDLEKVTKQAYAMVSMYGLNERIGNISFYDSQGREMFTKPYSEDTARIIDEEVSKMIEQQYQRALSILEENKDKLTLLAEKLLTSEVIFKEDLETIFGKRPWDREHIQESLSNVTVDDELKSDVSEDLLSSTTESETTDEDLESPSENLDSSEDETSA